MSAVTPNQPPRPLYAALTLAAGALAAIAAYAVARASAGPAAPALQPAALIAALSILGLLPVLVRSAQNFGLAVLGASILRLMLALFGALILTEVAHLDTRPVWLALVTGAGIMLVAETAAAIAILTALERKKTAPEHGSSC